jgi:hypothetical protein
MQLEGRTLKPENENSEFWLVFCACLAALIGCVALRYAWHLLKYIYEGLFNAWQ